MASLERAILLACHMHYKSGLIRGMALGGRGLIRQWYYLIEGYAFGDWLVTHGRTALIIPGAFSNNVLPALDINTVNHVIAVHWMISSVKNNKSDLTWGKICIDNSDLTMDEIVVRQIWCKTQI